MQTLKYLPVEIPPELVQSNDRKYCQAQYYSECEASEDPDHELRRRLVSVIKADHGNNLVNICVVES